MEKVNIKNRRGQNIVVNVNEFPNQKGLVVLMHGFLSFKEHPLLSETAKIFKSHNFTTVSFDTANSLGESDGKMEDATTTGYLEDLEDVIDWVSQQKWYDESFFLVGHSLGGYCVGNYAARHQNTSGLILFSPKAISEIFEKTEDMETMIEEWKQRGFFEWESKSNPGLFKRKGYKYFEDGANHNLLNIAENIKCPVLILSGDEDKDVPLEQQKRLFDKIRSKKQMHIFAGRDHNLKGMEKSAELHDIINNWLDF